METTELITQLLELPHEWEVYKVSFSEKSESKGKQVHIYIRYTDDQGVCKQTGEICSIYDYRPERIWRDLDILGYNSYLYCRVPRVKNSLGNVVSVPVPWADEDNRNTKRFDDYAIKLLKATKNQTSAGELLGISYEKVNRIMCISVERGLQRRQLDKDDIPVIHIDEKSYKKGHRYMTVISDGKANRVLEVGKDRTSSATEELLEKTFTSKQLIEMKVLCVDMWDPFIAAVKKSVRVLKSFTINFTLSSILTKA
jgi:transposase